MKLGNRPFDWAQDRQQALRLSSGQAIGNSARKMILACFLCGLMFAHHVSAFAQQEKKVYRLGYLSASAMNTDFLRALNELGYAQGKNLQIEFRLAKTQEQYPALAAELSRLNLDCVLTVGVTATGVMKNASSTIPIVMGNASADPVRQGLITSLARPGGNVTGVFDIMSDLAGKRIELLNETLPKLSRIAHVAIAASSVSIAHNNATQAAARQLRIKVDAIEVSSPGDLEGTFQRLASDRNYDALIVVGTGFFIPNLKRIVDLEIKHRLPTMHTHPRWVPAGGLMTYTTDSRARYRRAAEYVDRILKGTNPATLPVEQPTNFIFGVNLKTAKQIGVTIPPSVLARANEVIR